MHRLQVAVAALLIAVATVSADSIRFTANGPDDYEYLEQLTLPAGFGVGEFTLELWIRLDSSAPVGFCGSDAERLVNWCSQDAMPYSLSSWWFDGNWLLDGHNNNTWGEGSFDLQLYGGGRLRWLFGDGSVPFSSGETRAIQAWPADSTPTLLDNLWHHVTLVRRWADGGGAQLELWIDGSLIAQESTPLRVDMAATYWNNWTGFPDNQPGWFWGAEKQVAINQHPPLEDYKGWLDELRFWNTALPASRIAMNDNAPLASNLPGLAAIYDFDDEPADTTCNRLKPLECMSLIRLTPANLSPQEALDGAVVFVDGFESEP